MNLGYNYSNMGLQGLAGLGDLENKRNWKRYQVDVDQNAAFAEGMGNLIGTTLGTGLEIYQRNRKKADPTKVMDDPTQSDAAQEAKEAIRKRDIATGQAMSQKDEDNRWLQDNPMGKLVKQRGVVDYSNPFNLGGDWDNTVASALNNFPSRFFGGS